MTASESPPDSKPRNLGLCRGIAVPALAAVMLLSFSPASMAAGDGGTAGDGAASDSDNGGHVESKEPSAGSENAPAAESAVASGETDKHWQELEVAAEKSFLAGDLERARAQWKQALDYARGDQSRAECLATTLNQMCHLYLKTGELPEAHEALTEALAIRRRLLGDDSLRTAETMGNLAVVCHKLGHIAESEKLFRESLEVKERHLPKDSLARAVTLHNLAQLLSKKRQYRQAKSLLEEVVAIDRKHLGDDHVEIVRDLTTAGINDFRCGDETEAVSHLEEALAMFDRLEGVSRSELIPVYHYLGLSLARQKKPEEAGRYYELERQVLEKEKGAGHPASTTIRLNLARNADERGESDRAEELYLDALELEKSHQPVRPYELTECNIELGHFFCRHGDEKQAETYYRNALETYGKLEPYQKRKLYELPVALSELLRKKGCGQEADEISRRYLDVHSPASSKHFR